MSICIVDFNAGGHHLFYTSCISDLPSITGFVGDSKHLRNFAERSKGMSITVSDDPPKTHRLRIDMLKKHIRDHGAPSEFFLMEADQLDIPVFLRLIFGLGASVSRVSIGGIWFRSNFMYRSSLISQAKGACSRWLLTRWVKDTERLFFLDDLLARSIAHSVSLKPCDYWAKEPYPSEVLQEYQGMRAVPTLLFIGAHGKRKGTAWALNALVQHPLPFEYRIHVAGVLQDPDIEVALLRIEALGVEVILDNRFLSESDYRSAYENADVVMLPYIDFGGSSGVLMDAASYQKPVVATDYGLIGRAVCETKCGRVFTLNSVDSFIEAVSEVVAKPVDEQSFSRVQSRCSVEQFRGLF
ncbi:glycosyltransferase [Coraliomargarita sp. SDUM461003]|uniref:Glycosyltransferase n=1 Tax=Thalassobacterium maritimum TaxID=3041265 RepID=A0ABU1AVN3_9BACT|nr:glycosyltransferase [Coraliomargarita sp. SDUM461003]MDQ8208214.1 glycosyltransferase [Coraliomargarita sp. SDUM461003]